MKTKNNTFKSNKKGELWVSTVLWILLGTVIISLIFSFGFPLIQKMRDRMTYEKAVNDFSNLDTVIKTVASEGIGSQRVLDLDISKGSIIFDENTIRYNVPTSTELLEPLSMKQVGNVYVASDVDVSTVEYDDCIIVENSNILVNFSKIGTPEQPAEINLSKIINFIQLKDSGVKVNKTLSFSILDDDTSYYGDGYTELIESGNALVSATYKAHVDSQNYEYDLLLTLYSNGDFLRIRPVNLVIKN